MTSRFCKDAVFSATSTADLLANQPEYHHMNADENDVDTAATTQVLQLEKQVGLSGRVSLIVGTMIEAASSRQRVVYSARPALLV